MIQLTIEQWTYVLHQEVRRKKGGIVLTFAIVSLSFLILGLQLPKRYQSSTTIRVEEKNIIEELMDGTAVPTDMTSHRRNALEIMRGRRVLQEVLKAGGWQVEQMTPVAIEVLMKDVSEKLLVNPTGANLLKLGYTDSDPERTLRMTKRFAELFIYESVENKRRESREAFQFIDTQVQQYHRKLLDAEQKLKIFRGSSADAQPGSQADVDERINQLSQQIGQTKLDLSEETERRKEIERQLAGEAAFSLYLRREEQIHNRIAELQSDKENLLLNYYEVHPDVMRLTHQIDELKSTLLAEERKRDSLQDTGQGDSKLVQRSPLYQELRRQLAETRTRIVILTTRLTIDSQSLDEELKRSVRVANSEAELAELTRDYEVNRQLYGDLLRTRENSRVSMKRDQEGYGSTFKIIEPAALPMAPTGLRFLHFASLGLVLGILLPFGVIVLLIQVDPRIRLPMVVRQDLKLRLLATVPTICTTPKKVLNNVVLVALLTLVIAVLVVYGYVGYMKYTHGSLNIFSVLESLTVKEGRGG